MEKAFADSAAKSKKGIPKIQHLILDAAGIHADTKFDSIKPIFTGVAEVHYLMPVAHEILNPLDFRLFHIQQEAFARDPNNSSNGDIAAAARAAGKAVKVKMVKDAIHDIGYGKVSRVLN